jgi:ATP-dependent Clp protease, protease subunit
MALPPEVQAGLLDRRVVFMRGRLDATASNTAIAQLLLVSRLAPGQPIEVYLDSPDGSLNAALAVYDLIQTLGASVSVTCMGTAGGAAVLILAAGTHGQRFALPHARVHLTDDPVDMGPDRGSDPTTHAEEARRATARWRSALLQHATCSPEQLAADVAQSRWLSATEAQAYGLIDAVVPARLR